MKNVLIFSMVMLLSPYVYSQKGEMPISGSSPNSGIMLRKAWSVFADAHHDKGDEIVRQLVTTDPDCGLAYVFLPASTDAEYQANLTTALSKNLNEDERVLISGIEAGMKNGPSAQQHFEKLIAKYPKDNYLQLMIIYNTLDPAKSVAAGEALVKRSPKFAPAYNVLGYRLMEQKEMQKAEAAFNKYVALRPELANVYDSKGDFMASSKRYSDAVSLYDKAASMGMVASARKAERAKARLKYPDLSDSDRDQIKKVLTASFDAYEKGDLDAVLGVYSEQAIEISNEQSANVGLANIRARNRNLFNDVNFIQEDYTVEMVEGVGSVAVVSGGEKTVTKDLKTSKEESSTGNALFILRKQHDGQWKVIVDHFYGPRDEQPLSEADKGSIRSVLYKWGQLTTSKEPMTQANVDALESLYSKQAVEIMPWQGARVGIANLKARWSSIIGARVEYSNVGSLGIGGNGRRAIAWGIGAQELYRKDSQELTKTQFPWAMILTKEADDSWRILALHWYSE